jgi:hypothetical protein
MLFRELLVKLLYLDGLKGINLGINFTKGPKLG